MRERAARIRSLFTQQTLLILLGYCLYKVVSFHSYTTDFGLTGSAYGYISNMPFVTAVSVSTLVCSMVLLALLKKRNYEALSFSTLPAFAVMGACYLLGFVLPGDSLPAMVGLGLAWGAATSLIIPFWMELLALQESPMVLLLQLLAGSLFSAGASYVLHALPSEICLALCLAFLAGGYLCLNTLQKQLLTKNAATIEAASGHAIEYATKEAARRTTEDATANSDMTAPSFVDVARKASPALLAWGFFELIVGLVNRFAYGEDAAFTISASAPLEGMMVCAVLLLAVVFITNKTPQPMAVYLIVFPLVIGVFMLLPFFGERFGEPMSSVIYSAYICTTMLSNFLYLRVAHDHPHYTFAMAVAVRAGVRVMLMIGLALGAWFSQASDGESFVNVGIVAAVCVYCLVLVAVYWGFFNSKTKRETIVVVETETFEQARERRLGELAETYGLTPREKEVLAGLAQGHTARSMAEQMGVSVSTVQSHVKNLHVKLDVSKKQQILELFE